MLFISVYPNLILIDCYWHRYIIFRGLFKFFKNNKSSYTLVFIGVIVMTSHVKVIELKREREVKNIKIL